MIHSATATDAVTNAMKKTRLLIPGSDRHDFHAPAIGSRGMRISSGIHFIAASPSGQDSLATERSGHYIRHSTQDYAPIMIVLFAVSLTDNDPFTILHGDH